VSRGDLISHVSGHPSVVRRIGASLAWLDREPLEVGGRYLLKHATQTVRARIESLESRLELMTLKPDSSASSLAFNDLGATRIALSRPLIADRYADNRATGSFILLDEATNRTVAGGVICELNI
jgi:bifunctional enzyme CysN/CysC